MAASLWNPISGFGLSNFFGVSFATPTTNPPATVVFSETATSVLPDWPADHSADLTTNLPTEHRAGVLEATRCLYEEATDYISTLIFGNTKMVTSEPAQDATVTVTRTEPALIPAPTVAPRITYPNLAWLNACIASASTTRGYFEPVLWFYEHFAHKDWSAYVSKPPGFLKGSIARSYAYLRKYFALLHSAFVLATHDSSWKSHPNIKIWMTRGETAYSYAVAQLLAWKETGTLNMGLTLFALATAFYNARQCREMEEAMDQLEIDTGKEMRHLATRAVEFVEGKEVRMLQYVQYMDQEISQNRAEVRSMEAYIVRAERAFRRRIAAMERAMRRHPAETTEANNNCTEDVKKAMVKYSPKVDRQDTASTAEDQSPSRALEPLSADRKRKPEVSEKLESRRKIKIDTSSPRTPPRSATPQQQSSPPPCVPSSPFSFSVPSSLHSGDEQ